MAILIQNVSKKSGPVKISYQIQKLTFLPFLQINAKKLKVNRIILQIEFNLNINKCKKQTITSNDNWFILSMHSPQFEKNYKQEIIK